MGMGWNNRANVSNNAVISIEQLKIPQILDEDDKGYFGEIIELILTDYKNLYFTDEEDWENYLDNECIDVTEQNVQKLKDVFNMNGVDLINMVKNEESYSYTEWHHLELNNQVKEYYFFDLKEMLFI